MNVPSNPRRLRVRTCSREKEPLLEKIIDRPEAVMVSGTVLKHDATTTVTVVKDGAGHEWVIKRYNTKNPWHAVRRAFRTSRALICWRAAAWLQAAGIDTIRPVALMEERYLKFLRGRSYLVYEFVAGESLDRVLLTQGDNQEQYIERACAIVDRLTTHGIVHGDLKCTNFIVSGDRVVLVDLDSTRRLAGGGPAADLDNDRRRFLRNWVDHPQLLKQFEQRLHPSTTFAKTGSGIA